MSKIRVAMVLVLGVVLAGCDQTTGPDLTTAAAIAELNSTGSGKARGHADIQGTTGQGDFIVETYSFTAVAVGAFPLAKGQVQADILFRGQRIMVNAEVTCLSIVDNQAWIGSRVTRFVVDGVSQPAGGPMTFRVQDMGEGDGAVDLAALLFFEFASDVAYCNTRPAFPILRENMNGNIQVKLW